MTNEFWVRCAIENSIIVMVLALITESISRWTQNARIANLLWLVVLAKFMIPSFLFCELPLLPPTRSVPTSTVAINSEPVISNSSTGYRSLFSEQTWNHLPR